MHATSRRHPSTADRCDGSSSGRRLTPRTDDIHLSTPPVMKQLVSAVQQKQQPVVLWRIQQCQNTASQEVEH